MQKSLQNGNKKRGSFSAVFRSQEKMRERIKFVPQVLVVYFRKRITFAQPFAATARTEVPPSFGVSESGLAMSLRHPPVRQKLLFLYCAFVGDRIGSDCHCVTQYAVGVQSAGEVCNLV